MGSALSKADAGLPPSRPDLDDGALYLEFVRKEAGTNMASSPGDSAACTDHGRLSSAITSIAKELVRDGLSLGR